MISSFSPVFPFESSLSFIKNILNPDVRPIFETLLLRLELSFSGEWRKLRKLPFWLSYYFALYLDKMMVVMMMIFVNWIKQKRSLNRSRSTIWIFQIKMLEFTFEDSENPWRSFSSDIAYCHNMKEWNQKRTYNFFLALIYILMQEKSYIYVHPYYVEEERLLIVFPPNV